MDDLDHWSSIKEESLLFNASLSAMKFNDLSEDKLALFDEDLEIKHSIASAATEDHLSQKYIGLIELDQTEFFQKSVQTFTHILTTLCSLQADSPSSFEQSQRKKIVVQKCLHLSHIFDAARRKRQKKRISKDADEDRNVPVVVRLGVLTLFPLIESLSGIKDANYQKLCTRTLDLILSVISSVPTLALHNEPSDCLDAFRDFIYNLIKSNHYQVDTPEKSQATMALIGLALSRGTPQYVLSAVDVLFKIYKKSAPVDRNSMSDIPHGLSIGHFLKQIADHKKDNDVALLLEKNEEPWTADIKFNKRGAKPNESTVKRSCVTSDGSFLFTHSEDGLTKFGTGLHGTIKGLVYLSKLDFFPTAKNSSLAIIGDKLYFWVPHLPLINGDASSSPPLGNARPSDDPVVIVLDTKLLTEVKRVRLAGSIVAQGIATITSEGRYLYILGKRKEARRIRPIERPASDSVERPAAPAARASVDGGEMAAEAAAPARSSRSPSRSRSPSASSDDEDHDDGDEEEDEEEEADWGARPNNDSDESGGDVDINADLAAIARRSGNISFSELLANSGAAAGGGMPAILDDLRPPQAAPVPVPAAAAPGQPAQQQAASDEEEVASLPEKYVVEIFDPLTSGTEANKLKTIDLNGPSASSSSGQAANADERPAESSSGEPPFPVGHFERSSFYTNGFHLIGLIPPPTLKPKPGIAYTLNKSRVFSLADGKHVGDHSFKQEPGSTSVCFDQINNLMWTYYAPIHKVTSWLNSGVAPELSHPADEAMVVDTTASTKFATQHRIYSPEWILSRPEYTLAKSKTDKSKEPTVLPFDAAIIILAHMDRLARQHPYYNRACIFDESMFSSGELPHYHFCVEPDKPVLGFFYDILQSAVESFSGELSGPQEASTMAYVILSCLRLLKLNLRDTIAAEKKISKYFKDDKDKMTITNLREILLRFVDWAPPKVPAEAVPLIRAEACRVLTLGFVVFYPLPSNQIQFVLDAFENKQSPLLGHLVNELADWYRAAEILNEDPRDDALKASKKDANKDKDPKERREIPTNKFAGKLLASVVTAATEETRQALAGLRKSAEETNTALVLTPAVRLLLSFQRELAGAGFSRGALVDYATLLFSNCTQLIREILTDFADVLADKTSPKIALLEAILQHSIIRTALSAFVTTLSRRALAKDATLGPAVLEPLIKLLQSLDALCKLLPDTATSDLKYLNSLGGKKEARITVETKHPYPYGKNQFKETVTIPGAEALALRFDPKCRTSSASSDTVHLYANASLDSAILKDGNPVYYAGTNWPKQTIIVPGNTVTFSFSANSRPDPSQSASRWGFRCVVTQVEHSRKADQNTISHWLLELEAGVALLGSRCAGALIEGEPVGDKEKQSQSWLDSRLLNGGFDDSYNADKLRFLESFAEAKDGTDRLYEWMKQHSGQRPILRKAAKDPIEKAERFVLAAMFKHLGLVDEALTLVQLLADGSNIPATIIGKFDNLAKKVLQVTSLLIRRGEMQKDWQIAVEDKVDDFDQFNNFQQNPQRLLELCEMKGVECDLVDTNETVKRLFNKLQEEIAQLQLQQKERGDVKVELPNPFELISQPVIERARFLLRLTPASKTVSLPSAQTANPFSKSVPAALRASTTFPHLQDTEAEDAAHPLSRSLTQLPSSDTKKKTTHDESFSDRVSELRKWLQAYTSWKDWQDSTLGVSRVATNKHEPPRSPIQALISFSTSSTVSLKELERIIKLHIARAKGRIQGLEYLCQLLAIPRQSFASVRHQLLIGLPKPLRDGGHYLDSVSCCGDALAKKITETFGKFFDQIVAALDDSTLDTPTRLYALNICGISFRDTDVTLLAKTKIFHSLRKLLSEPLPIYQPTEAPALSTGTPAEDDDDDEDPEVKRAKEAERQEEVVKLAKLKLEADSWAARNTALQKAAWTSFRLLAAQCIGWNISATDDHLSSTDKIAVLQTQELVFTLLSEELNRVSQKLVRHDVHSTSTPESPQNDEQCFQLLSLMYLIGGVKTIARKSNIDDLLRLLGTNLAPRSQRLVLRLCRKMLPHHGAETAERLVNFMFDEIAIWTIKGKLDREAPAKSPKLSADKMDVDSVEKPAAVSAVDATEEDEEDEARKGQYSVVLHAWTLGHRRLAEACINTLGQDFFAQAQANQPAQPGSGLRASASQQASRIAQQTEVKAAQLVNDLNTNGSVLLKVGTQEQCNRLATAIATQGGSVVVGNSSSDPAYNATKNGGALTRESEPFFWTSGHIAESISSEIVALLRFMLDPTRSSVRWFEAVKETVKKQFLSLEVLLKQLNTSEVTKWSNLDATHAARSLAALSVLSFSEAVRVGGKVTTTLGSLDERPRATVVEYNPAINHKAHVVFDSELADLKTVHKIAVPNLSAEPEFPADPARFVSLAKEVLPSLLRIVCEKQADISAMPRQNRLIYGELIRKILDVICTLASDSQVANMLLTPPLSQDLPVLIKMAQACDPIAHTSQLQRQLVNLTQRLWDLQTLGDPAAAAPTSKAMAAVLPHFSHASKAELLPTAFEKQKTQGLVFWGSSMRCAEYYGQPSAPQPAASGRGGRSMFGSSSGYAKPKAGQPAEVLLLGNALVPRGLSEYYFEVTIEAADSSALISVGLCPEGTTNFGNNSYRFQANRIKTWFVNGNRRQENYGNYYRNGSVVGCGWNQEEKSIHFTKDGEDLGVAFQGVFAGEDKIVPVVAFGKGVKVRVNFGQEPFKYNLELNAGLDEKTKEARRKEAEERHRKEIEAEEARIKKQQADEEAARREAAKPITNMGYTLKQGLKALEMTNYSGAEAAVVWLLENPDFNFDDEPEPAPKEEPAKAETPPTQRKEEPAAAAPQTGAAAATSTAEKDAEKKDKDFMDVDVSTPAEDTYDSKLSTSFYLGDCYSFSDETSMEKEDQKGSSGQPGVPPEWEERIMPDLRGFMERDGFSRFEVSEYLQQIKNELASGNEAEAKNIIAQILGEASSQIRLNFSSRANQTPAVKTSQLSLGMAVTVFEPITAASPQNVPLNESSSAISAGSVSSTVTVKDKSSPLSQLAGRTGFVHAIDHQKGLVQVQFYNPDTALIDVWVVPVGFLKQPKKANPRPFLSISSVEQLQNMHSSLALKLANVYARRIILALLEHCNLGAPDSPISVTDALSLSAGEHLSSPQLITSPQPLLIPIHSNLMNKHGEVFVGTPLNGTLGSGMELIRDKLIHLFHTFKSKPSLRTELTALLIKEATVTFEKAYRLAASRTVTINSASAGQADPLKVDIPAARTVVVVMDRNTHIVPQAKLGFYLDEECTDPIAAYTEKSPFFPFTVPSNKFYVKLVAKQNRTSCRFKFAAIPATTDLALARWIVEFIVEYGLDYEPDLPRLFDAIVDCIYRASTPSNLKESLFCLLSRLIHKVRRSGSAGVKALGALPMKRLVKLRQEMISLYDVEKKRSGVYSGYLQALIELIVSVKLLEFDLKPIREPPKKDEAMLVAMELVKTLEESGTLPTGEQPKPADITSASLTDAIASALQKAQGDHLPADEVPGEMGSLFGDEGDIDEDEALRLAMELSMAQESGSAPAPATPATPAKSTPGIAALAAAVSASLPAAAAASTPEEKKTGDGMYVDTPKTPSAPPAPPLPTTSASPSSAKKPKKYKAKDPSIFGDNSSDPSWFTQIVAVAQAIECLWSRDPTSVHQNRILADMARRAWNETRRETLKGRLVLIENLPTLPADKHAEFCSTLEEIIDDHAQVVEGSIFLPIDHAANTTKSFAVVELQSIDKAKTVVSKLNKHKLKVGKLTSASATSAAAASGTPSKGSQQLSVWRLVDVEGLTAESPNNASRKELMVKEFLTAKLFDPVTKALTAPCKEALTTIFKTFATDGSTDGVLGREEFDALQMASVGEKMADEDAKHMLTSLDSKKVSATSRPALHSDVSLAPAAEPTSDDEEAMDVEAEVPKTTATSSGPVEVTGVTLKGFLDHYTQQCADSPQETWGELLKLGFDLHLHHSHYFSFKQALVAILHEKKLSNSATDEELVRYAEQRYTECELSSPIQLSPSHLAPISLDSHQALMFSKLSQLALPTMRLRFEMLRDFNVRIGPILQMINFGGSGILAQQVSDLRSLVFHSTKMAFVYEVLDKTAVQGQQPVVTIDRLKLAARKEGTPDKDLYGTEDGQLQNTAFGIAYQQLRAVDPRNFRQKKPNGAEPHFSLKVDFKGENVEGESGPYRQFFTDVSRELTGALPLFIPCPNAQAKLGNNRDKFILSPSAKSRRHLRMLRFVGQLMGMAFRTGSVLTVDLPAFFWKPLVDLPLRLEDLKEIDQAFFGFLQYLRLCDPADLEGDGRKIFEKFVITLSDKSLVQLKPGGDRIDLNHLNRDEYLFLAEKARLLESTLPLKSLRRGLSEIIPLPLLKLCTWQDLEWRICGRPTIDVNLLKRHTIYSGVQPNAPHIRYFWQVLRSLSQADRRAFVRFAWAQERLPASDEEFTRTHTRMLIKGYTGTAMADGVFPKADTCFFNIQLPPYSTPEVLRQRLLFAIFTDADSMNADRARDEEERVPGLPSGFQFRPIFWITYHCIYRYLSGSIEPPVGVSDQFRLAA